MVIALKDYLLEVIPAIPKCNQLYKFLYKNRLKEEDVINIRDFGFTFEELLETSPISEDELKNARRVLIMQLKFFSFYKSSMCAMLGLIGFL